MADTFSVHKIFFGLGAISCSLMAQEESDSQLTSRWAALTVASIGVRYFGDTSDVKGESVYQGQHQELVGGAFRFDAEGKYTLQTVLASGPVFNTSWNNASGQYRIYWKQFYFAAKPMKGVELQVGGLGMESDAFTEIIGYSGDGYITGERLAVHRPENLFFDTLSATYAYLGDLNAPDMTGRFRRMGHVNFRQYLATKKMGEEVAEASFEYTDQWGMRTVREGLKIAAEPLVVVDALRGEYYERINSGAATGFNLAGEKKLFEKLTLEGGYASIDPNFGDLNADNFLHGRRVYVEGEYRWTKALRLFAMVNHGVDNHYPLPNRTHVDVGFVYDILKALPKEPKI